VETRSTIPSLADWSSSTIAITGFLSIYQWSWLVTDGTPDVAQIYCPVGKRMLPTVKSADPKDVAH